MKKLVQVNKLYKEIRNILLQARFKAYKTINSDMVLAYWSIGNEIVEEEQSGKEKAKYGNYIIQELSIKLTEEFGKGFNERNLRYMRSFYLSFPKWNAVRSELTWTHYRLLSKVENKEARKYYMQESIEQQWSSRALERQINSFYF